MVQLFLVKLPNYFVLFLNKSNCHTQVYLNGLLKGWKVACLKWNQQEGRVNGTKMEAAKLNHQFITDFEFYLKPEKMK